jgi:protein-disulfide isomerase
MSELKPPVGDTDHVQGKRDAAIVLVEYGDYQCPYCGAAYPQIKAVQQSMGERLCFVFRNFPLTNLHPQAMMAASFAEAAATVGKFWEMHDMIFENQRRLNDRSLVDYAKRVGLDDGLIESALQGNFEPKIRADFKTGVRSGVNGTPTLFVNGKRFEGPAEADALLEFFAGI